MLVSSSMMRIRSFHLAPSLSLRAVGTPEVWCGRWQQGAEGVPVRRKCTEAGSYQAVGRDELPKSPARATRTNAPCVAICAARDDGDKPAVHFPPAALWRLGGRPLRLAHPFAGRAVDVSLDTGARLPEGSRGSSERGAALGLGWGRGPRGRRREAGDSQTRHEEVVQVVPRAPPPGRGCVFEQPPGGGVVVAEEANPSPVALDGNGRSATRSSVIISTRGRCLRGTRSRTSPSARRGSFPVGRRAG